MKDPLCTDCKSKNKDYGLCSLKESPQCKVMIERLQAIFNRTMKDDK